ncbi:MAG: gamma-glutamyl-gamma-aminobutyrate hydrolase family protein [Nitrospirae bacterium]|nr:gamma-glutamyl-gamma-aminobutyrate hydrolase family protein [Nitrospirota bacterium]MBI5096059.1 gamma-glutamyl-gamma-aminobutyrate hydrolase family protein [Nitrospirota bacterium]
MPPIIAITAKTEELRGRPQTTIPEAYAKAIEEAGGIPLIIPVMGKRQNIASIARIAQGFIFSGGDDIHPRYYGEKPLLNLELSPDERTDFEIALFREVIGLQKPILGICLGTQLINVALGGSLYQDIPTQVNNPLNHRGPHQVSIVEGTLLHRIFRHRKQRDRAVLAFSIPSEESSDEAKEIQIMSAHHQAVKTPGKDLTVSALSPDGVIEAIAMTDYPFLAGVQWHPEREPDNEQTRRLFNAVVEAAKKG